MAFKMGGMDFGEGTSSPNKFIGKLFKRPQWKIRSRGKRSIFGKYWRPFEGLFSGRGSKRKNIPTTIAQKKAYPRKNDGNYLMNK